MKYIIGVDIGGTNTDAVLVDENETIIATTKVATTEEINEGFEDAILDLLKKAAISPADIEGVFLGTTHATNAILQRQDLFRVGVIRIAGQYPDLLPPGYAWPQELRQKVIACEETISGGFNCDGGILAPLCKNQTQRAIHNLIAKGAESIAIVGVFAPLNGDQEDEVAALVPPQFPVSLSYEIGGIGFIERENSTILNAALKQVMLKGFLQLQKTIQRLQITGVLMVTQNDGSLISLQRAINYPVLTISAGSTNSFIGGSRLAQKEDAIIVDIGGTSTDVGLMLRGFPDRSLNRSMIGGVSLNSAMPDVLSIALGGGSYIRFLGDAPQIGPESVGKDLTQKALCFGGDTLTLTDAAVTMETLPIPNVIVSLTRTQSSAIFCTVKNCIEALVNQLQLKETQLPVIFVGGGAGLLPQSFLNKQIIIPQYFNVANAYGAALSEISGTVDTVVSLQNREKVLLRLYEEAKQKAIDQGAQAETLRLVDQQILPYSYVPNQMARVIVRYSGKRIRCNS